MVEYSPWDCDRIRSFLREVDSEIKRDTHLTGWCLAIVNLVFGILHKRLDAKEEEATFNFQESYNAN